MKKSFIGCASLFATLTVFSASSEVLAIPTGYNLVPLNTGTVTFVAGTDDGDGFNGGPPVAEGVANAVDGTTNKFLSFQDLGSGFAIQVTSATAVTGLQVFTANDAPERDPATYLLEGSNTSLTAGFSVIASGGLSLPAARNATGSAINDVTQANDSQVFANTVSYSFYRVTFPTLKDAATANSMQLGEVRLLSGGPAVVPEASTVSLLGMGAMMAIGAIRLRRRK